MIQKVGSPKWGLREESQRVGRAVFLLELKGRLFPCLFQLPEASARGRRPGAAALPSLPLPRLPPSVTGDYVGSVQVVRGDVPHVKILNMITPTMSPLPCKTT